MKTAIFGICVALICAALYALAPTGEPEENLVPWARESLAQCVKVTERFQDTLIAAARAALGQAREVTGRLAALNPPDTDIEPETPGVVQGKVQKGETIASLLDKAGIGPSRQFANAAANVLNLKNFKAGQPYAIFTDPATGRIRRFEYEVSDTRRLIVEGESQPQARMEDIEYTTLLESCEGVIDDSLFQAIADIGENPALALKLVELFGSEINFIRDIQEGDSFSALIEKRYREGEYRGYGRILAATFTNRGKTYEAWMFRDPEGNLNYYNSKGENLKKTLLMAPLAVTRLTSKFTHTRRHPILGGIRPHLGVDYAAPTGTPVKAVGNGVVTRRGWNGGYGNQIVVRHAAGLESMYAHLSGYAPGLRTGQKVKQGQVIGFVGSTGMSTGPHLDFRLRQGDKFINPAKAINPRGAPVDPDLMASFRKTRDLAKSYLEGRKLPEKYELDSIVPDHVSLPKSRNVKEPRKFTKRQLMLLKSIAAQKRIAQKRLKEMERSHKKRKRS
ncbi:MAG: M23 family metallopeptidase [Desulfovibrio sp.]|nr:M23 family metallopeptidase [Desulfovibrio sp.]